MTETTNVWLCDNTGNRTGVTGTVYHYGGSYGILVEEDFYNANDVVCICELLGEWRERLWLRRKELRDFSSIALDIYMTAER